MQSLPHRNVRARVLQYNSADEWQVLRLLPQTRAVEDVLSLPDMAQVRLSELYFTGVEVNHASHSMSSVVRVVACVL